MAQTGLKMNEKAQQYHSGAVIITSQGRDVTIRIAHTTLHVERADILDLIKALQVAYGLVSVQLDYTSPESLPHALRSTLLAAYKPELSKEELAEAIKEKAPNWLKSSNFTQIAETIAFLLHTSVVQLVG